MKQNKKRKKRNKKKQRISLIMDIAALSLLVVLLVLAALWLPGKQKEKEEPVSLPVKEEQAQAEKPEEEEPEEVIDLSSLSSASLMLMDLDSGEVLANKGESQIIYPASLTKIMTVLVALENIQDMNASITLTEDIFPALYEEGASMAGFQPGETATYQDVLYGAILPSGGECCEALAQSIAGSEEAFVQKMNDRAKGLEMKHTHFTNTTGLQDVNHYSSVEDMAVLLQEALKNQAFRDIFTTRTYSVAPTNLHPEGFTFRSSMFQAMEIAGIEDSYIKGGKTGYTSNAGLCLASLGEVNGKSYILVTAHADGSHDTDPYHVLDAVAVYGQLAEQTAPETEVSVSDTEKDTEE